MQGTLNPDATTIILRIDVTNPSDRATEAARLELFLSTDGQIDTGDASLDTRPVPGLPPKEHALITANPPVPDVPAGRYYVLARVRARDDTTPLGPVLWGAPLTLGPDLAPDEASGTREGPGVRVHARVWNRGTRRADAAQVHVTWIDGGHAEHGAVAEAIPALAPGEFADVRAILPLSDLPVGPYRIGVHVDPGGAVTEADKSNNRSRSVAAFAAGPDLAVLAFRGESLDGAILVHDTVENRGAGPSASCGISFFLSRNGVLDAGDVALGYRVVPPLDAGGRSAAETRLALPRRGLTTGRYFVLGKVDSSGAVAEADEANNVSLAPSPLDLRLPP